MNPRIQQLQESIQRLEEELEKELLILRERFSYTVEERRIRFQQSVAEYHRRLRKNVARFFFEARPGIVLVSPVILGMFIPIAMFDLCVGIYQAICFPVYGIKKVPRSAFIVMDRHHLQYLNAMERLNCAFCSYANGVVGWARQVAARTEGYWCPIKHAQSIRDAHPEYAGFEEFGDAEGFRERMNKGGKKGHAG
ncbi:MAG: hypothetical protein HZA04_02295 [Nitrospinae bacterium]|nr:hypothetical protein [Nitrospinota bacterium]